MLGNYLIGLREGVEAALIVSILLGYLTTTGRQRLVRQVWIGVMTAAVFSAIVAVVLQLISTELSAAIEPVFTGAMSFVAVGVVTWMIFWMKRTARTIATDLKAKVDTAAGSAGVVLIAFAAVAREGGETAVFFWAAAHAAGHEAAALAGLVLGLVTAVAIGAMVFRSTRKVNLHRLFKVTGIALVFLAAGVLSYGVAEWQEVALLPGANTVVLDLSAWLPEGSLLAVLAGGLLNLSARTTGLQVVAYAGYAGTVLYLILRPRRSVAALSVPSG